MNYGYDRTKDMISNSYHLRYFAGSTISLFYMGLSLHQRKMVLLEDCYIANHQNRMFFIEQLFSNYRISRDFSISGSENSTLGELNYK